jgi:transitional endoplasmic reticulum ATPase
MERGEAMAEPEPKGVQVQVANARPEDVGKGVARVSRKILQSLGIQQGDVLEIIGQRHTAAIAITPYPEDEDLEIIRLDGLQRANAGVTAGERIEVRRIQTRPATRVTLGPAQKNLRVVSTSVYQRGGGAPPDEFFRQFYDRQAYALQEVRLSVVSTTPKGIVRIEPETEIELLPHYVEPKETRRADVT